MVVSMQSQHGENLAATQANTEIDDPDEVIAKGGRLQRQTPTGAGRVHAHDGKPGDPIDDGLGARRFTDAKGARQ
jgi:hypothetical protein